MSSRQTEISDIELDESEELKNEVFTKLSEALLEQKRLLKRFYDFCEEYNHFEYDEMGINMDEAEDMLRKTNKIRDLFLSKIEENLLYIFEDVQSNTLTRIITCTVDTKEDKYKVILEVMNGSFNLELQ